MIFPKHKSNYFSILLITPRFPITNKIKFKLLSLPLKGQPSWILAYFRYIPCPSECPPYLLTTLDLLPFPVKPYSFMPLGHCTHCHRPWNFLLSCVHASPSVALGEHPVCVTNFGKCFHSSHSRVSPIIIPILQIKKLRLKKGITQHACSR